MREEEEAKGRWGRLNEVCEKAEGWIKRRTEGCSYWMGNEIQIHVGPEFEQTSLLFRTKSHAAFSKRTKRKVTNIRYD